MHVHGPSTTGAHCTSLAKVVHVPINAEIAGSPRKRHHTEITEETEIRKRRAAHQRSPHGWGRALRARIGGVTRTKTNAILELPRRLFSCASLLLCTGRRPAPSPVPVACVSRVLLCDLRDLCVDLLSHRKCADDFSFSLQTNSMRSVLSMRS